MHTLFALLSACSCAPPETTSESSAETDSSSVGTDSSSDDTAEELPDPSDAIIPIDALIPSTGTVHIMDISVVDDFAYLATAGGVMMVALSTMEANENSPGEFLYWSQAVDGMLLLSGRDVGMWMVDIDGKGDWSLQDSIQEPGLEGLDYNAGTLFVAGQEQGLLIIDGESFSPIGQYTGSTNAIDVLIVEDVAWVLDRDQGLLAVDVSDPAAPTLRGSVEISGSGQALVREGDVLVVAATTTVTVVDISSPDAPAVLADIAVSGSATRAAIADDLLAVAAWSDTLLYSLSDPADPALIAIEDAEEAASSVALVDGMLVVGDWNTLRTFSIDPSARSPEIDFDASLALTGDAGTASRTLIVTNRGDLPLEVTDTTCDEAALSASPADFSLAAGESDSITISATIKDADDAWIGTCTFLSNDADEPEASLSITINAPGLAVGDPAPDFSLPDLDGVIHTLSDQLGEVVMVSIFSNL